MKGDSKRQRSTKIDTQRQVTVREYIVNGSKKSLVEPEDVQGECVCASECVRSVRECVRGVWVCARMTVLISNYMYFVTNTDIVHQAIPYRVKYLNILLLFESNTDL